MHCNAYYYHITTSLFPSKIRILNHVKKYNKTRISLLLICR